MDSLTQRTPKGIRSMAETAAALKTPTDLIERANVNNGKESTC